MRAPLTDRSIAPSVRRRLILEAAVRSFARKGYHACRVADIAEEAGVAHGLVYHYFASKEALLETIFHETWSGLLGTIRELESADEPAREQLRKVAALLLRSWRRDPDLVRVLVREVAHSADMRERVSETGHLEAIARIVARGQERGEFRRGLDPTLTALVFYGAIEEILTAWVLGRLPDGDNDLAAAEQTLLAVVCGGLGEASPVAAAG
jgi:AcrR family transcriptional regulator